MGAQNQEPEQNKRIQTLEYIENNLPGSTDMSGCFHTWVPLLTSEYTERAYCRDCLLYMRRSTNKLGGIIYRQLDEDLLLKLD